MIDIGSKDAFEVLESRDYSGLSIAGRYLVNVDSEKAFFNGANLSDRVFEDVKFNNTEFTEGMPPLSRRSSTDLPTSTSSLLASSTDHLAIPASRRAILEFR